VSQPDSEPQFEVAEPAPPDPEPPSSPDPGVPVPPSPRRAAGRLAAFLEIVLCSGYPTQILLTVVLSSLGLRAFDQAQRLQIPFVVILSLLDAGLLLWLIAFFCRAHGERMRDVMLGNRSITREVALGVMLTPLVLFASVFVLLLIQQFLPWLHNVARNPFEDLIRTPAQALLFAFIGVIAGGVREEVQRGFILHRFDQYLGGAPVGLVLFSVVFGAGHALQGDDTAIVTGLLGLAWGIMYIRRRSIVSPMVSHSVFNVTQTLVHFFYARTVAG
jgi:membrane protease YdiL (CAAX protease family)